MRHRSIHSRLTAVISAILKLVDFQHTAEIDLVLIRRLEVVSNWPENSTFRLATKFAPANPVHRPLAQRKYVWVPHVTATMVKMDNFCHDGLVLLTRLCVGQCPTGQRKHVLLIVWYSVHCPTGHALNFFPTHEMIVVANPRCQLETEAARVVSVVVDKNRITRVDVWGVTRVEHRTVLSKDSPISRVNFVILWKPAELSRIIQESTTLHPIVGDFAWNGDQEPCGELDEPMLTSLLGYGTCEDRISVGMTYGP